MKLRIRLKNFKGVFARMWFNIAMTSDRLSFASVEIDKSYSFTLHPWKNFPGRGWSRDQPRPGSLFPTTREAEERDPGNEVAFLFLPHFDVICDLLLNRRTATWNLFVELIY